MTAGTERSPGLEVMETLPIGLVTLDTGDYVTWANDAAALILGWAIEDLIGRRFHETAHHSRPNGTAYPASQCPFGATRADRLVRANDRETLWRKDGTPVICDVTASPLTSGGVTLTMRDAFARLELARAQDEFIGVVSHELRTPLASLIGALKLSAAEGIDAAQRELLIGIAHRNADRLARLVDDILDLEKMRAGAISLLRTEMTALSICNSAADAVAGSALARHVTIAIGCDDSVFWADQMRLEQVLTNLLDNAIKHSPGGSTVTLRAKQDDADVVISVSDQGPGIAPDDLTRIFERFWQTDSSVHRTRQGSGLGLTISTAIAELHGGSISVTSELGRGTQFSVRLPLRARAVEVPVDLRSEAGEATHAADPAD